MLDLDREGERKLAELLLRRQLPEENGITENECGCVVEESVIAFFFIVLNREGKQKQLLVAARNPSYS